MSRVTFTEGQYRAYQHKMGQAVSADLRPVKRAHKYNATRSIDSRGMAHPSKVEAEYISLLYILEKAGEIVGLRQQVGLRVGAISYKPDFLYNVPRLNKWVVGDVKGFEGERFRLVCQLWKSYGGQLGKQHFDTLTVVKRAGKSWQHQEVKHERNE